MLLFIGMDFKVVFPLDFSLLCGTNQVLFWPLLALLAENNQTIFLDNTC